MLGQLVMYDPLWAPAFMFICGILLAFFGRKLVPLALVLASLSAGLLYGGGFIAQFTDSPLAVKWGPVVVAILLSVLVIIVYRFAFFVAGLVIGFFIAGVLLPESSIVITGGIALGTGALVYFFRNFVFSILTAVLGASLAATGTVNLLAWTSLSANAWIYWSIAAVIAVCGIFYQLRKGRK